MGSRGRERWSEAKGGPPSRLGVLGGGAPSVPRLLPRGKVSSLLQSPAVASRAIYFSAPKPLSHLFTQWGKELGSHPGRCPPYPTGRALQAQPGTPLTASGGGGSGARITGPPGPLLFSSGQDAHHPWVTASSRPPASVEGLPDLKVG